MLDLDFITGLLLLGATPKFRLAITLAMLAGTLLLAALIISRVDRWRKRSTEETLSTHDQLAEFRELYEQGQLSEEEYRHIRRKLGAQLREELDQQVESAQKSAGGDRSEPAPEANEGIIKDLPAPPKPPTADPESPDKE